MRHILLALGLTLGVISSANAQCATGYTQLSNVFACQLNSVATSIPPAISFKDSSGNVWTLVKGIPMINGSVAGGGYNTVEVLYNNNIVYSTNTGGNWFRWNGSGWILTTKPNP